MSLAKPLKIVSLLVLLAGCAASPTIFNQPMPNAPGLSEVNRNVDQYKGTRVRWGGVIASVKNKSSDSWIEVVQYRLDQRGRPVDGNSEGRFFLKIDGFLEPQNYRRGREITGVGEVTASVTQKIGEHNYIYPVVTVDNSEFILWNELSSTYSEPYPASYFYYSPFYDPFYAPYYRSYFYGDFYYHPYRSHRRYIRP